MANETVLVIGGGIAGPAMALFLKKAGFHPVIFEAHAHVTDIGGALQIAPNGMAVLDQLGLARVLLEQGIESAEFCFENQFGRTLGCVPNGPGRLYDIPAVQVSRAVLHRALLDELERQQIPIHYEKRLQDVLSDAHQVIARFHDGSSANGSLLIGADGIHSRVRRAMFPESPAPFYTGLITVGGFAAHEALRPRDAQQQSRTHLIFGLNGFFGYGYCDPAHPEIVMWWSHLQRDTEPTAEELATTEADVLRQRTLDHHRGWAEPVGLILENTRRVLWGPVHDLPNLERWSKDRVVLIGDAAHAISPHAGQGASLALEDAICVARHLRTVGYREAFLVYQQERQRRVEKIMAAARKRGGAKHALPPNAAKVRDLMLSMFLRLRGKHIFEEAYRYKAAWA